MKQRDTTELNFHYISHLKESFLMESFFC